MPADHPVSKRRTFAIIAHPDAGKTTLTEKLLLFGGAIQLAGEVKAKKDRIQTRSDWMNIERDRGISVVTSVMTFEYKDCIFNLLDTPGHEDFADDTYRTLTAVDSAVMVIDAAKGIEPRTFDLHNDTMRRQDNEEQPTKVSGPEEAAALLPENEREAWLEGVELARGVCRPFDLASFREGHMTPVYFGSALKNYGVRDLIEAFCDFGPSPRDQQADTRMVGSTEDKMTGFVFKIQANMDPNHRDRIAFLRVCSGKLSRGMKAKLVRTGKPMSLSAPQFFFARSRQIADEAFAGDVVGIPNHGTLRIGDTLTEGEDILFRGVPNFAPEILRRVRLDDAMKAKKLREALQQMAEEGVVQLFVPDDGSPAIVGVVGALQIDVLTERLKVEYSLPVGFEMSRFSVCRWITADDPAELDRFIASHRADIAHDLDHDPVFLAQNGFSLNYEAERWKDIRFATVKDYQVRDKA